MMCHTRFNPVRPPGLPSQWARAPINIVKKRFCSFEEMKEQLNNSVTFAEQSSERNRSTFSVILKRAILVWYARTYDCGHVMGENHEFVLGTQNCYSVTDNEVACALVEVKI